MLRFAGRKFCWISVVFLWSWITPAADKAETKKPSYPLLKHRLELAEGRFSVEPGVPVYKDFGQEEILLDSDTFIQVRECASSVDLAKAVIARSDIFRLTETPMNRTATNNSGIDDSEVALTLGAKFIRLKDEYHVFFHLMTKEKGNLVASAHGVARSLEQAIESALRPLERAGLCQPWRCRVLDVSNDRMLIERGRLDGLAADQFLSGYSLAESSGESEREPVELLLLKRGRHVGHYRVVEVGEEFTALKPHEQSPMLKKGDVLEVPPVVLLDVPRSRESILWDGIYGRPARRSSKPKSNP